MRLPMVIWAGAMRGPDIPDTVSMETPGQSAEPTFQQLSGRASRSTARKCGESAQTHIPKTLQQTAAHATWSVRLL